MLGEWVSKDTSVSPSGLQNLPQAHLPDMRPSPPLKSSAGKLGGLGKGSRPFAFFCLPGLCSVSQASIDYLLTQKGKGNMLVVVVGGLDECKHSVPGSTTLVLKKRTGFIHKALQHG